MSGEVKRGAEWIAMHGGGDSPPFCEEHAALGEDVRRMMAQRWPDLRREAREQGETLVLMIENEGLDGTEPFHFAWYIEPAGDDA